MPSRLLRFAGFFWLALSCANLWAKEETATNALPFRIRHWTTENGLPQDRIACLKQTRDGYLWIGTWYGLARFDGVRFTLFNTLNTPEIENDSINGLTEDADGTLWIATKNGLVFLRNNRFQRLADPAGTSPQPVWHVAAAKSGGIWFCTDNAVTRWRDGKFSTIALEPKTGAKIQSLFETKDDGLNLLLKDSWLKIAPDAGRLETNRVATEGEPKWIATQRDGEDNRLWVGTIQGLLHYEGGQLQTPPIQILATNEIYFLYRETSGTLWVNPKGKGLFRGDGTNFTVVDLGALGLKPRVTCMAEDDEGSWWVGTDRGLFQLQRSIVRVYTSNDGLPSDNISTVCEDSKGTIWVATDSGASIIQNDTVEFLGGLEPETRNHSRCVWPGKNGNVWLGRHHGSIIAFSGKEFSESFSNALFSNSLNALYEDRSGRLWVGANGGAVAFEPRQFDQPSIVTAEHGIKGVHSILEDRAGTFWFGTKNEGLARLREGIYSRFTKLNGLSDDSVWNIYEDAAGSLWLGTANGLTRYRDGKFFAFTREHGLRENTVNCVLEDDYGNFWISGLNGIYRVKREDLDSVADGRKATFQSITLGTMDGLESAETNGERQPSGWKSRDGRIWFPTTRGLAVIDPQTFELHKDQPRVVIEGVKADEKIIFNNSESSKNQPPSFLPVKILAGRGHLLEFTYTAISFSKPEKTPFRYRLAGVDANWHEETQERTVRYLNLRPGRYRFEVIAANRHGLWNERPAGFAFSLEPHFWQTWPFYLACIAGTLGMIASVLSYRLRWQRRFLKIEAQNNLADERSRIARDLHDDLGTALTGLALELDVVGREGTRAQTATNRLSSAAKDARSLAQRMREVVWAINPRCDNTSSLTDFLEEQIAQFLSNAGIQVRLDFPEDIPTVPIDAETRYQLALCVRETLNNIVRHAQATQVVVRLEFTKKDVLLFIKDNGRGFSVDPQSGHGLSNIRTRLQKINGTFEYVSVPGGGAELRFGVPMSKNLSRSEKQNR